MSPQRPSRLGDNVCGENHKRSTNKAKHALLPAFHCFMVGPNRFQAQSPQQDGRCSSFDDAIETEPEQRNAAGRKPRGQSYNSLDAVIEHGGDDESDPDSQPSLIYLVSVEGLIACV